VARPPNRSRSAEAPSVVSGRRPVLELLKAGRGAERILISRDLAPSSLIGEIRKRAEGAAIPVRLVPKEQVDRSAGGTNHQGVVAIAGEYRYEPLEDLVSRPTPSLLFLDGLTDPHNLGSLLRSADGAGFAGVVIPSRRSVAVTAAVRRVAAGAAEVVPVARVTNLGRAMDEAKRAGIWLVGLDEKAEHDIYTSPALEPPVGLVLGAEDRGLSPNVKQRCDDVVKIPSHGRIASLNVAVAGAIAMFEIARRRGASDTL
jgi:23S rRNA (guanosine2251-2'-O)-methyltransferase